MARISLSLDEMNSIITKIGTSKDDIATSWNSIKTEDVEAIKASWAGADCDAYINKVMEMDAQMQNAIGALELLANTYGNARDEILRTQQSVADSVGNL